MNKFILPVVAVVVRAAAQMVVRRRSRAPGRRARRVHRTVGHVAARPLDNDISLKRAHMKELFAAFDAFGNKSIGFNKDWTNRANPAHHVEGIPKNFPERNGGVCFMLGAGASIITRDWLNELASNPGPGGTDQMPLRRVLWRHREHLFDLPSRVQCRCRKESICENGALLWHLHRIYRLDVLRRVGNASEMCGFVP